MKTQTQPRNTYNRSQYCAVDQLKYVQMNCQRPVSLRIHFQSVRVFVYEGKADISRHEEHLFVPFSESLRSLRLTSVYLDKTFDWTKLKTLWQLSVENVYDINKVNFNEFTTATCRQWRKSVFWVLKTFYFSIFGIVAYNYDKMALISALWMGVNGFHRD